MMQQVRLSRVRFVAPAGLPFRDGFSGMALDSATLDRPEVFVAWRTRQVLTPRGPWSAAASSLFHQESHGARALLKRIWRIRRTVVKEFVSVAEVITTYLPVTNWPSDPRYRGASSDAIWRAITAMREAVTAHAVSINNHSYDFTYESLHGFVLVADCYVSQREMNSLLEVPSRFWSLANWGHEYPIALDVDLTLGLNAPTFPSGVAEFEKWMHALLRLRQRDPLTRYRVHMADARAHLQRGRFDLAVIAAQTAGEVLLLGLLSMLLWEQCHPPSVLKSVTDDGISKTCASFLPRLLGGDWRPASYESPTRPWREACGVVRNRVVHGGYSPSRLEGEKAVGSAEALSTAVGDRLWARANAFPVSALHYLGEDGLAKRGSSPTRAMRALMDNRSGFEEQLAMARAWFEEALNNTAQEN
jgi:hypothetical protein